MPGFGPPSPPPFLQLGMVRKKSKKSCFFWTNLSLNPRCSRAAAAYTAPAKRQDFGLFAGAQVLRVERQRAGNGQAATRIPADPALQRDRRRHRDGADPGSRLDRAVEARSRKAVPL